MPFSWSLYPAALLAILVTDHTAAAQAQQRATTGTLAPAPTPVSALAIVNARVWTGDVRHPWADAVLVRGERIDAVGSSAEIRKRASAGVRTVDAHGMMVTPGFTDAHVHFLDGGFALASVQLRDAPTRIEFIRRIKAFAATIPAGTWILNGDWDHTNWGGELPERSWIDSVTPRNQVWINRLDGHMNLANSLALAAAGITRDTKDVAGGTIVRDSHGEPTGSHPVGFSYTAFARKNAGQDRPRPITD